MGLSIAALLEFRQWELGPFQNIKKTKDYDEEGMN